MTSSARISRFCGTVCERATTTSARLQAGQRSRAASLNHLVGAQQQLARYGDTDRFRGLQVDHELELSRLLDRQIAGFRAFEDLVDVGRRAVIEIRIVSTIGNQTSGFNELAI